MRIDHVTQPYQAEIAKKIEVTQKKEKTQKAKKLDIVEVSQDAKLLSKTKASVETAKAHVAQAPDVRTDKVNEVKQKIKEGYYDSPEFAECLAEKLITDIGKELGIS